MGGSSGPVEARHRLSSSFEDIYKRRLTRSAVKGVEKPFSIPIQDRSSCGKFPPIKFILVVIIGCTIVSLLYSPDVDHLSHSGSRWIWGGSDPRYVSDLDVNWEDVMRVIEKLGEQNDYQGIGLLNFNNSEVHHWNQLMPDATHINIQLDYADKNMTWDSLYPEWIDEEQEKDVPVCPSLPKPDTPRKRLDLIAVKLPCRNEWNWSRDVARLHLQVAAANLAASAKGFYPVHLLFITGRFPIPNLFTCKELVVREGNVWLYKPDTCDGQNSNTLLKQHGPIQGIHSEKHMRRFSILLMFTSVEPLLQHKASALSGSNRDLVILVDETISAYHRSGLAEAGWEIRTIQRIRNPKAEKDAYNEWNYSKFRLWQLTDYDKIIFIDADLLILRNIDFLFGMPEISATGNNASLFNSGVMVIEPSNCTFNLLMEHINEIESYNGGDQGYLNEVFTWWHRIPKHMNFLKHFWIGDEEEVKQKKTRLFAAEPPILYVLHYLGVKPWLCFRDYDCNWNVDIFQEFASDIAHEKWWRVHDAMPEQLHQFCSLKSKQKAQLEFDRREAEKANYTDGHWKIKVQDRRLKKCVDNVCNWKSMLKHWGETNWTNDEFFNPSPPAISTATLPGL
ncbi:hypothetical protein OIU77_002815 [Salix suchowensis]|uniref:Hexosyltransferase n=1 Tax=Salix suchowensis TaxID=1278906 RepID=A0ABQ9AZ55_9ROSI|nr:hypothetical protein OIU77_002815 [Salix suchowensis]